MIIDFHTHVFPREIIAHRDKYLDDDQFSVIYKNPKSRMIDHRELILAMNKYGIDRSFVMGFPWLSDTLCELQNNYFSSLYDETEGKIIPFATVPSRNDCDVASWIAGIKQQGFRGIGEIAFYHSGLNRENLEYLEKIFHYATRHHLVICLHVNEPIGHDYPGKYDTPFSHLWRLLNNFPDAEVVLAHWGGGIFFYELMPEIKKGLARVRYDTAASPFLYEDSIYDIAADIIGSKKIIFGSDYPLTAPTRYLLPIKEKISDSKDQDDILFRNSLHYIEDVI
jgi:uncharacterized protein